MSCRHPLHDTECRSTAAAGASDLSGPMMTRYCTNTSYSFKRSDMQNRPSTTAQDYVRAFQENYPDVTVRSTLSLLVCGIVLTRCHCQHCCLLLLASGSGQARSCTAVLRKDASLCNESIRVLYSALRNEPRLAQPVLVKAVAWSTAFPNHPVPMHGNIGRVTWLAQSMCLSEPASGRTLDNQQRGDPRKATRCVGCMAGWHVRGGGRRPCADGGDGRARAQGHRLPAVRRPAVRPPQRPPAARLQ